MNKLRFFAALTATLVIVISTGCASKKIMEQVDFKTLARGETGSAGEGDLFFSIGLDKSIGQDKSVEPFKVYLLRLNSKEIILKHVSYYKKEDKGEWLPVSGVKTYTFPVTMKILTIAGYKFLVISHERGKITYRRLK